MGLGQQGIAINQGTANVSVFKNDEGNKIIQLSNNMLTVNRLPSYIGWENFEQDIIESLDALKKNIEIKLYNRVGLKFINKIDIEESTIDGLKKYFEAYPNYISKNKNIKGMQYLMEFPIEGNNEINSILIATILPEKGYKVPIIYQLYAAKISNLRFSEFEEWISNAHIKLKKLFQDNLTDFCKRKFDE
ncbi:MAG: TIGR04255 family protein [Chloroflexia bacterium]|nr:TIGR04255 family protein [Chloroflexia bacterium]